MDKGLDQNANRMFTTRSFLPGWWVRAFEAVASQGKYPRTNAIEFAWWMRMLPALDLAELNALAVILGELQAQLLSRGDRSLRIDPYGFEKHATSSNRSRLFGFAKVLQWLPALRLLHEGPEGLTTIPIFWRESWQRENGQLQVNLDLHGLGAELLLGYSASHLDMLRWASGQSLAAPFLGPHAPLGFWRSAWMELQGPEQAFLLRLEKAMQWENRWLHFDGIFGKNLNDLIEGLEFRVPRRQQEHHPTAIGQLQWLLERLGRKLVHQGLLRFEVEDEYLAVSEVYDSGTLLVWQTTAQKTMMEDCDNFRSVCLGFVHDQRLAGSLEKLCRVFCPGEFDLGEQGALSQLAKRMLMIDRELFLEPVYGVADSVPVMPLPTFLEWRARLQENHPLPLPDQLVRSELAKYVACPAGEVEQGFRGFVHAIQGSFEYREAFSELPLATISLPSSWQDEAVQQFLHLAVSASRVAMPAVRAPSPKEDRPLPRAAPETHSKPKQTGANMRRLAAEELNKLRVHEPDRYRSLKQQYLESLDESRRKLILDVQGRMAPDSFEAHLRNSLIKYMLENPSAWQSARAGGKAIVN